MSSPSSSPSSVTEKAPSSQPVSSTRCDCRGWISAGIWGVVVAGTLSAAIVAGTWAIGGRGLSDRAMTDLAMPIGALWLFLLTIAVAATVRRRWAFAGFVALLWVALTVIGNRPLAYRLRQHVEFPAATDPADAITEPLDAIVLLGGYAWVNQFDAPELGSDGQRLMSAAQLWHAGKTKTIICTGTAHYGEHHPSKLGRQMLTSIGVPDEVIFESPGENTTGEMQHLKEFFADPPPEWVALVRDSSAARQDDSGPKESADAPLERTKRGTIRSGDGQTFSVGLVTSAIHLPRAMRLAHDRQLSFRPLGCQFSGSSESLSLPNARDMIPSASGADSMAAALKEMLAWVVGR